MTTYLKSRFQLSILVAASLLWCTVNHSKPLYFWKAASSSQQLVVSVYPKDGDVPLRKYHEWIVTVHDRKGSPIRGASIRLAAGMQEHGHGMPSAPQVTGYLDKGRYLVEGMKFNMAGDWMIDVFVETSALTDEAAFDISLEY